MRDSWFPSHECFSPNFPVAMSVDHLYLIDEELQSVDVNFWAKRSEHMKMKKKKKKKKISHFATFPEKLIFP